MEVENGKEKQNIAAQEADGPGERELLFAVPTATAPRPVPRSAGLDHPTLFFNRELSWLDFNWRVLYQALDERVPLLERVRYLAIAANNLDEFYRKRVGGLKRQHLAGVRSLSPDGRTAEAQLDLVRGAAIDMQRTICETWEQTLQPSLKEEAGIEICSYADLSPQEEREMAAYFRTNVFPILTPLAVDPGHPFPFISNLSLSIAIVLRHPKRGTEHFARVKVPTSRGRWVRLPDSNRYVALEQIIIHNLPELFRGMEIVCAHVFRITRNADIRRNEEEADDLIELISEELRERRFAPVVRLEVEANMPPHVRRLLMRELSLEEVDLSEAGSLIDYSHVVQFANLPMPEHRFAPWEPVVPASLLHEGESKDRPDIFSVIRSRDLLVHHPYESFRASVQRFIEEAADDEHVIGIKQTLYRTSDESPIMAGLIRAAEAGKQVAVLVEVKARFDEENNIEWGQMLEKSGVHVTYGLVGLKTHAKVTLVIREEEEGPRAYCHLGTGNYNPSTARLYTDLGLFTCAPDVGYDVINLFHYLTGYAPEQHYQRVLTAPRDMRDAFIRLIQQEIAHQKHQGNGRIICKMNALDDIELIQELYRASLEGVQIDLIVRGHCRLRPGLPHFSENIRVISIIGRFLEHSRIYYFNNNGHPLVYTGSADWQRRNLDDRVETIVQVDDPHLQARAIRLLHLALEDRRSSWELMPDGRYAQRRPRSEEEEEGYQERLMRRVQENMLEVDAPWDIE